MKRSLIAFLLAVNLDGCFGYKPFQPPPSPSESWSKAGASETDVASALLECGVAQPRGRVLGLQERMTPDENALALLCMEHSGFLPKYGNSYADYCSNSKDISSCQPGTPAPPRDVNKRLNSQFCKRFPHADVCS